MWATVVHLVVVAAGRTVVAVASDVVVAVVAVVIVGVGVGGMVVVGTTFVSAAAIEARVVVVAVAATGGVPSGVETAGAVDKLAASSSWPLASGPARQPATAASAATAHAYGATRRGRATSRV